MRLWLIMLLQVLFASCNNMEKRTIATIKQWIGKEIVYPKELVFTIQGADTLRDGHRHKCLYTILSYVDSVGCTSCKLQLPRWQSFIEEIDSISKGRANVYFVFHSKNEQEVINTLKVNRYRYPVWIDRYDSFNKLNHFPSDMAFQTFLLNENNKVIALGNPIYNLRVKELYLKIIQGKKGDWTSNSNIIKTEIFVDRNSISLGNFDWREEQKATFSLKNTGDKPLVIEDITTSCGCTSVNYSKEPVKPNDSLRLSVIYKAEHPEHFSKTITVHCNAESSPIRISVSGDAK